MATRLVALFALALIVTKPAFAADGLFPPGFAIFCSDHPSECAPVEPRSIVYADWRDTLDRVNRETNAAITYRADDGAVSGNGPELYDMVGRGEVPDGDRWDIAPEFGDCDDYAVTKRNALIRAGVPRGSMRLAYVLPVGQQPHLFLVVTTDEGEMVLDNNSSEVLPLDRIMLARLSIQDEHDPRLWHQVY